jgi:hypothetical protein
MAVKSFRDFLAEQAERIPDQETKAAKRRDEWIASLTRLNDRIKDWLQQDDPNHVLSVEDLTYKLREEGIGEYEVNGLSIGLGPRYVRLQPVARTVAGPLSSTGVVHIPRAYGRVDMTDGLRKFMLFRVETEPQDSWRIIEQDGYKVLPFDQQSFESALQSLLE